MIALVGAAMVADRKLGAVFVLMIVFIVVARALVLRYFVKRARRIQKERAKVQPSHW